MRASQTISGTTSYLAWDTTESVPLLLADGANNYIQGPEGEPVEQVSAGGTVTYLHHDQAGSTRLITSSTGTVTGKCTYSAYGTPSCEGTGTTPLGYDGQYTSTDTGLIYLRARIYDPTAAQFLSVDSIASVTRSPYDYARDNPVTQQDPSGLPSWSDVAQVLGVAGVCVITDGAGCVAAGLADLDANVISNDIDALIEPCSAFAEEAKSLNQLVGFLAGAGVGQLAGLAPEIEAALERIRGGQFAVAKLRALGISSGTLTGLLYAKSHPSPGSTCSCTHP